MKQFLNRRVNISISTILVILVIFTGLFIAIPKMHNWYVCGEPKSLYDDSLLKLSELDTKARIEWKAFPRYIATDEWSKWQEDEGYKDPGLPGGRIYPSYENYWKEKYAYESAKELRISSRIVVNNPACFDPRTVSEEQEFLDS